MSRPCPRVLIIAGSDSGGGAGIQADIKTVTVLGGFAMTAVTAITVQNTTGVSAIHPVPLDMVIAQAEAVLDDIGADVIKIGMLGAPELITAVAGLLDRRADIPVVLDPVMVAKGGAALLEADGQRALRDMLLPRAAVITPNLPEAAALTGQPAGDSRTAREATARLLQTGHGARAVLLKGGHGEGEMLEDLLLDEAGTTHWWASPRLQTRHTHGTGCTMASALATHLAAGLALPDAVAQARQYVRGAMQNAPGLGAGHGPLAHGWQWNVARS